MKGRRWGVQNRPTAVALQGALYGFLTGATVIGGIVAAIAADQVRKYRNERRLARAAR